MKKHISPFKANTTHIALDTIGDHAVGGWWVVNGMPKLQKYAVIECHEIMSKCDEDAVSWLMARGVKSVQILVTPRPVMVEDGAAVPA